MGQRTDYRGVIADEYCRADTFEEIAKAIQEREKNSRIVVWPIRDLIPDEWGYTRRGYKYTYISCTTLPRMLTETNVTPRRRSSYRTVFLLIRSLLQCNGHRISGYGVLINEDKKEITGFVNLKKSRYTSLGTILDECKSCGFFDEFHLVNGFVGPATLYIRGLLKQWPTRFLIRSVPPMIMIMRGSKYFMRRFRLNTQVWIRSLSALTTKRMKQLQEGKSWLETFKPYQKQSTTPNP